jgi:hypothetical protein
VATTDTDDHATAVARLLDREAIRDVIVRYARGLDRGDWDLLRACFTAGATDDHGPFQGSIDNLVEGARKLLAEYWGAMHILGQSYIELDGDQASMETYALSVHRRHGDGGTDEDTLTGLRYLDSLVREQDGWKIAARVTVHEWNTTVPARDWIDGGSFVNGRRDRLDASYEIGLP